MPGTDVAASTFPFLYSHGGLDALKHLRGLGYDKFEMMIFPPHCWPAEMTAADRRAVRGPSVTPVRHQSGGLSA